MEVERPTTCTSVCTVHTPVALVGIGSQADWIESGAMQAAFPRSLKESELKMAGP